MVGLILFHLSISYDGLSYTAKLSATAEAERRAFVTTGARAEIVAAEGSFAVVTGHAVLRAGVGEMLFTDGGTDLQFLCDIRSDVVTIVAAQALPRAVIAVQEADRIRSCACCGA